LIQKDFDSQVIQVSSVKVNVSKMTQNVYC
jgi:hypothetical protein